MSTHLWTRSTRLVVPLAIAALGVSLVGGAPPASAATTYVLACDAGSGPFVVAPGGTLTLDGSACDAVYLSSDATSTTDTLDPTSGGGVATVPNAGTGRIVEYTAPQHVGSDSFYVNFDNGLTYLLVQIVVDEGSAPPPWLQQYGRHAASDPCAAGWDPSWAEWTFDRAGGYVCQRTVYWNRGGWYVSPSAVWGTPSVEGMPWDGN